MSSNERSTGQTDHGQAGSERRMTGVRSAEAGSPRTASRAGARRVGRGDARRVMSVVVVVLTMSVATVWSFATLRQLGAAIERESADHLGHALAAFASTRARTLDDLRTHCRVMVEDPRLKSTLATEGVDQATVADILNDLSTLRRTGFLMVLSPDGKVFAQAGADELRGLDLSGSSPVKKAQGSPDVAVGSWVVNGKMMDLSIMGVRFGTTPVAYLVVGQTVGRDMLKAIAAETGVAIASVVGETVMLASPEDEALTPVFTALARQVDRFEGRTFELAGRDYLAAISELEDTGLARPRLVLVRDLASASGAFELVRWLILTAPCLMLVAVLFAMIANRTARIRSS
jgi:hypothetical protein